jgi:glycosyltransferase involved in cell wall biosynthesis
MPNTVSVVMTAKNSARTIRASILSLQISLSKSDEILIFLDGCTDLTSEIVSRVRDSRIRIFSSNETIGRSAGRNRLIEQSQGVIIAILDSDDIALPWRFWQARRLLRRFDAVFTPAIVFGRQLRPLPIIPQVLRAITAERMPIECLGRNPLVHSSATFKRSVLIDVGLYRESEAEEYDLWLRMLNSGYKLYRSSVPAILYRFHKSQASQSPGFVQRGLDCSLVQGEQIKLAEKLGLASKSVSEIRLEAQQFVRSSSFLAAIEVAGIRRKSG